ncbi:TonB-dependent receptor [Rhizorhabdus histidinilytica]|uniref:TonB-dependent receptor n=1 Tax=Rhizorhabdus histidinilytica TaxID=439228 RepID=UPI0032206109
MRLRAHICTYTLLSTVAAVIGACPAWAQADNAASLPAASNAGQAMSDDIGDIVVTAQKRSESVRKVPINITALGGGQLATLDVRSVQDFTAYVPSFRVTQPGNAAVSAVSIRGVGQRDINVHNEGAVAEFVDGAYVSFIPAIGQPLFDVERVEVLKGPQGTLFGRNATGGLISIISKRPTEDFDAYATAQYGSYNELKLEGAVGGKVAEGVDARLSANYQRNDGYIKNATGPALNANDALSLRFQVLFKPASNVSYLVSARYWKVFDVPGAGITPTPFLKDATGNVRSPTSAAEYAAFCAPLNGGAAPPAGAYLNGNCFVSQPDRFSGAYSPNVRFNQRYYGFTGTGEWEIGDGVSLTSITDYQHLGNYYASDIDGSPAELFTYVINDKASKQFSQELRLNGSTSTLKWVAGLYYLDIDHDVVNVTDLYNNPGFGVRLPSDYQQHTKSYAVFGQLDWAFLPKLTASLGLRGIRDEKSIHNVSTCVSNPAAPPNLCTILGSVVFPGALAFNRIYDGAFKKNGWSGRAVLQYKPNDDVMIYAGVTRGTKGGGFNSGAAEFYPLSVVQFKPETLVSYEAGIKASTPDRIFSADGSVFHYDYSNYQSYSVSADGGLRVLNVDAEITGAELALTLRPIQGLSLNVAGTYLDTKQKRVPIGNGTFGDFQMPDAPKWSINGEIRYGFPILGDDEATLQLNSVYVSRRSISAVDYAAQRIPSYYKLDARISYALPGGNIMLAAFANNFTNQKIISTRVDFTTVTGNTVDTLDRPRWFGGSISWKY